MLGSPGIGMGVECLSEFWGILGTGDVLTPQKKQGQHGSPHCCTQQPHQHELCPPSCTAGTLVRRLPVFCWFCRECRRVQGSVGSTSVSQSLNSQSFYLEPHLKQRVPVNPRLLSQFSPRANCPPLYLSVWLMSISPELGLSFLCESLSLPVWVLACLVRVCPHSSRQQV